MKRSEKQGNEGKVHPVKRRVPKIARRGKKAFFNEPCLIIEETTNGERLEISSEKLETSREHSAQRRAQ